MNVTICNVHGAGTGEPCCQHSELIGWYEEREPLHTVEEELESKETPVENLRMY